MSYRSRMPEWYQEDPTVNTENIETEFNKLQSYYDFLRRFVKQPMQIWCSYKPKDFNFAESNLQGNQTIPIDITGSFSAMFNFIFEAESSTFTNAIDGPITIFDGTNTVTINASLPSGATMDLSPLGRVRINEQEIMNVVDQSQLGNDNNISFGLIDGYTKFMQIFNPTTSNLEAIVIEFCKIVGEAIDNLYVELYELDDNFQPQILIDAYTIFNSDLRYHTAPFELFIPFNDQLDITKTYAFIIRRLGPLSNDNYFILKGDATFSNNRNNLLQWDNKNQIWINAHNILYFKTLTPIISGDLPIINPPIGNLTVGASSFNSPVSFSCTSNNLELDTIYTRSTALPIYPLKEMDIVLDGTIIPINVSFYTEDEEITISPDDLKTYYEENLKGIYLLDTLKASITLNDFINFPNTNTVLNIAPRSGLLESGEYTLIFAEGSLTNNNNNPLNYCSIDFVTNGAVEIYDPSGNIDEMVVDRNVLAIVFNEPIQISNLSKIELKYNNGTILKTQTFQKAQHQYCNCMSISADEIPDGLITTLPFKVYLETSWYNFEQTKKQGFPQDSTDEDNIYWPNDKLSEHSITYGLFRRTYRNDIEPFEYINTYPIGYSFLEEQDYFLEKRILNEYATRSDKNPFIYLQDGEENNFIELRCKIPGISNTEVYGYNDIDGSTKINVVYISGEKVKIIETYLFTDAISLVDDININSKILVATYLNNANTLLLYNIQTIVTEGVYPNYGLIRSEIYSHLGVIPSIKDMIDYGLIWDKKNWDDYLWSGGMYSTGVFRIDIPFPPSNFIWLTNSEISTIINKCKKVGTTALSTYTTGLRLPTLQTNKNFALIEDSIYMTGELGITTSSQFCSFNASETTCDLLDFDGVFPMAFDANISNMEIQPSLTLPMSIGLRLGAGLYGTIFFQDTDIDFFNDILINCEVVGTGSSAYIQLIPPSLSSSNFYNLTEIPKYVSSSPITVSPVINTTPAHGSGVNVSGDFGNGAMYWGFGFNPPSGTVTGIELTLSNPFGEIEGYKGPLTITLQPWEGYDGATNVDALGEKIINWNGKDTITLGGPNDMWPLPPSGGQIQSLDPNPLAYADSTTDIGFYVSLTTDLIFDETGNIDNTWFDISLNIYCNEETNGSNETIEVYEWQAIGKTPWIQEPVTEIPMLSPITTALTGNTPGNNGIEALTSVEGWTPYLDFTDFDLPVSSNIFCNPETVTQMSIENENNWSNINNAVKCTLLNEGSYAMLKNIDKQTITFQTANIVFSGFDLSSIPDNAIITGFDVITNCVADETEYLLNTWIYPKGIPNNENDEYSVGFMQNSMPLQAVLTSSGDINTWQQKGENLIPMPLCPKDYRDMEIVVNSQSFKKGCNGGARIYNIGIRFHYEIQNIIGTVNPINNPVSGLKVFLQASSGLNSLNQSNININIEVTAIAGQTSCVKTINTSEIDQNSLTFSLGDDDDLWGGLPTKLNEYDNFEVKLRVQYVGDENPPFILYYLEAALFYANLNGSITTNRIYLGD